MVLARDIRRNARIVAVAVAFPAAELISAADVDVLLILAEIVVRDCAHKITTQQFIAGSKEMRHRSRGDLLSLCAGRHGKSVDMLYFCQAGSRIAIASDFGWSVWQDVSFALQSCARAVGSAGSVHAVGREKTAGLLCARTNWIALEQLVKVLSRTMLRLPPPISTPTSQSSNVLLTLIGDPF